MSARQNKKRGKGRNNVNTRERTISTPTEDPSTPYLVPAPSEEQASSPVLSTPAVTTSPVVKTDSSPGQSTHQSADDNSTLGYSNLNNGSMSGQAHALSAAAQYQQYPAAEHDAVNVILPPGKDDLEILENLKQMIKNNQHPMYRPIPRPQHLAAIYLGTSRAQKSEYDEHDAQYREYPDMRGSYEDLANQTSNSLPEEKAPTPPSPTHSSRRPPRVQLKDTWERSKTITEPPHESPSSNHHEQPQAPRVINISSAPSASGPPSATDIESIDAKAPDVTMQSVDSEEAPAPTNGHEPVPSGPDQPQNDAPIAERDPSKDVPEAISPEAVQVKSEPSPPPPGDPRREVIYSRPPGPPIPNVGYDRFRGRDPRDARYDYRDYRERRLPFDRYRDNRYTDARRPPPEDRHYEPAYARPPDRRYSDAKPYYPPGPTSDFRPPPGHVDDGTGSLSKPASYVRPSDAAGSRQTYPPPAQTTDSRHHEALPVNRPPQESPSSKSITAVAAPAPTPTPPAGPAPTTQTAQKPAGVSQAPSAAQTPPIPQAPPPEEARAAVPAPAEERIQPLPVHESPKQPQGPVDFNRSNAPSRQATLDDRLPPSAPARFARPPSPAANERATYPPPASSTKPLPSREERTYRPGPPSSPPTRPPPVHDYRAREQSRERQAEFRPSSYRPPPDRSYDHRRPDAMDVDNAPPRYTNDRPPPRNFSPERSRPPPPSAGSAAPSNPPYDRYTPGSAGRDYYPSAPYNDRDEYRGPPASWDRPAGRPPPPSTGAGDRDRFPPRDPPPPSSTRPYTWDPRDERDRRDSYPPPRPASPRYSSRPAPPPSSRPYDSNPLPPPPSSSTYNRVRQRSLSPARRPPMDDARPPLKRPREDEYGDYYPPGAPPARRTTNDYPPRGLSPPPSSGGSGGYYDRAPPSSASTTGSGAGGPPPGERSYIPSRDYSYDRPRSPPPGGRPYTRPPPASGGGGGYGGRYPPQSGSSMPPPRRP